VFGTFPVTDVRLNCTGTLTVFAMWLLFLVAYVSLTACLYRPDKYTKYLYNGILS